MYSVNQIVQAIDGAGRWERARVTEIHQDGASIHFLQWSKIHDRVARFCEIRTDLDIDHELNQGGRLKRKKDSEGVLALKKLVKEDSVKFLHNDQVVEAEVLVVDKFSRQLTVLFGEEVKTIQCDDLVFESRKPEEKKKKVRIHKRLVTSTTKNGDVTPEVAPVPERVLEEEPNLPEAEASPSNDEEVFCRLNSEGILVQGGKLYSITELNCNVCVESVSSSAVKAKVVVKSDIVDGITVIANLDKIKSPTEIPSRMLKKKMSPYDVFMQKDALANSPIHVRLGIRKAFIGSVLRSEVQSSLKLSSFRRTFSLGIVCPMFDVEIFNLTDGKVEYSYNKQNMSYLDSILGSGWDTQSLSGHCRYVTKLVLRIKDLQLSVRVHFAICRCTLPIDYRSFLSKYDVGSHVMEEEDDEDCDML